MSEDNHNNGNKDMLADCFCGGRSLRPGNEVTEQAQYRKAPGNAYPNRLGQRKEQDGKKKADGEEKFGDQRGKGRKPKRAGVCTGFGFLRYMHSQRVREGIGNGDGQYAPYHRKP